MTIKDKLELGLKEGAAYRRDNLPPQQVRGPQLPTGPGRSPEVPLARADKTQAPSETDAPTIAESPTKDREGSGPALRSK